MQDVLTLEEVAEYLRAHPTTIYRLLKKQQIPVFRVGVIGASTSRPSTVGELH
jgi:excisionase family DNA binding protein